MVSAAKTGHKITLASLADSLADFSSGFGVAIERLLHAIDFVTPGYAGEVVWDSVCNHVRFRSVRIDQVDDREGIHVLARIEPDGMIVWGSGSALLRMVADFGDRVMALDGRGLGAFTIGVHAPSVLRIATTPAPPLLRSLAGGAPSDIALGSGVGRRRPRRLGKHPNFKMVWTGSNPPVGGQFKRTPLPHRSPTP